VSPAGAFERVVRDGGVALFPADTVYGLACDPESATAITRLYQLKGRPPAKASAVMFFDLEAAVEALPELGEWTRAALLRLLPGGVTVLLRNPARRYPLACGEDRSTLGLRVVAVAALAGCRVAVLQSSANRSGEREARTLAEVPDSIRSAVDLVVDGGSLPGTPSTIVDLRRYEEGRCGGGWTVVRGGAVSEEQLSAALDGQFHFNPATYEEMIREDLPDYERLQEEIAAASAGPRSGAALPARIPGRGPAAPASARILDLGTGTGETAARLLARHPDATLVGIDESEAMLGAARERLVDRARVELLVGRLQDPLPAGPFDLVASALSVHHLSAGEKIDLFERVRAVLTPGGRFVLGDVVIPEDPSAVTAALTPGYDKPSTAAEQLRWLSSAGFHARLTWAARDLAVLVADAAPLRCRDAAP
jgi:tRNA threonylcarbamoyl adenosine modification protein (Sua5/YciO/YrdC/YwlC family)